MKAESRQIPQKFAARLKFAYCIPPLLQLMSAVRSSWHRAFACFHGETKRASN